MTINLKELPEEVQWILIVHCTAFSLACECLEQSTGIPTVMWASKIAANSVQKCNQMSPKHIEKILTDMMEGNAGTVINLEVDNDPNN
jgi:aromatic ring hydroxylase